MTFPNLSNEKIIAFDIETYDPSIGKGLGSGARRDGYILGVGIAALDKQWYFPIAHKPQDEELFEGEKFENVNREKLFRWLKSLKHVPTVGANILYDLDYTQYDGYIPDNPYDIQFGGPLLDENKKSYSLDSMSQEWLNEKKETKEMDSWCKSKGLKGDPRQYIYLMPVSLVAKYCAHGDCRQTLEIHNLQMPEIKSRNLETVYDLERSLIPVLLQMKRTGVRIDVNKLNKLKEQCEEKEIKLQKELKEKYDIEINENGTITNAFIRRAFDKLGYKYEMTDKDNACFDKESLRKNGYALGEAIIEYRHVKKTKSTYIEGLEPHIIDGRIHTEFNPLRISRENGEEYGTRIGRFSSSAPSLQVIPRKDAEGDEENIGGLIRSLFIPEENNTWAKLDYSKMEMVIGIHYARGRGATEFREKLNADPAMLIYEYIASLVLGCSISEAKPHKQKFKSLTLGKMYMMSADKLGRQLGLITLPAIDGVVQTYWNTVFSASGSWDQKLAAGWEQFDIGPEYAYLDQYMRAWREANKMDKALPWIKETSKAAQDSAIKNGYVCTMLKRRRRFDDEKLTYKALQAVISGTGADIMKSAMVKAYKDGIFDIIPCHLTCHDELDVSVPDTKEGKDALMELKNIMETVIKLKVPLRVEVETGRSWGEVEKMK
jgi:DNA polymerase-1